MPGGVVTNQVGTRLYWRHNPTPLDRNRGNGSARNKWGQLSTVPICSVVSEKKKAKTPECLAFSVLNSTRQFHEIFGTDIEKRKYFKKILWDFYFIRSMHRVNQWRTNSELGEYCYGLDELKSFQNSPVIGSFYVGSSYET